MGSTTFSARYTAVMAECGGRCPIEAGVLGRLADHECCHDRLPYDRTAACGCWPQEGAAVLILPALRSIGASCRRKADVPIRGDTTGTVPGGSWAAFNAIADYLNHGRRCTTGPIGFSVRSRTRRSSSERLSWSPRREPRRVAAG
jgi:hypothetical protein